MCTVAIDVEVVNISGQKVFEKKYDYLANIPVNLNLETGVYLLTVNDGEQNQTSRISIR